MKKIVTIIVFLLLAGTAVWFFSRKDAPISVTNFEECVNAGYPVMESYPRQCNDGKQTFTENIGNTNEKSDLIRLDSPRPNETIKSPLTILGEARGTWFFEASFPVVLVDWDGKIIAQGIAQAKGDWMTADFVPFEAKLTFTVDKNIYSKKGNLILKKDNPSGLPEKDDALEIPIIFATSTSESGIPPKQILPYKSGVKGVVSLGPTCPVMRDPPDPNCADKPYQTTVQVIEKNSPSSKPFAVIETNKAGEFSFSLRPGEYSLQATGGKTLPRCEQKDISISPNVMSVVNVSCDTGIR